MTTTNTLDDVHILRGIINPTLLGQILELAGHAEFVDGRATASDAAKSVKQNLQIDQQNQAVLPLIQQALGQALMQYPLIHTACFPMRMYPFLISKYEPGMGYGWHVDSPIMGNPPVRTDLAMTLFLSDPDTYEGGALVIKTAEGEVPYKLAAGDAVVYPCHYVHCVSTVTKGARLAAVTWIQSAVRYAEQRAILLSIRQIHEQLSRQDANSPETVQLLQTWSNLLRMWAEV